jgi:leader peptidase (prepilin peptidase)/N-methyltransferase
LIWFLESHSFLVAVSASFLFGILLDMLLKKLTGSEKIGYVAVTAAVFIGAYGTTLHALACILTGQVLLFAAEYDCATHTVPDYVPVLILMAGLLEVEFAPALLGLVLVPLPFVVAALMKEGSIGGGDIKLMGACGFVLGVKRGYIALMLGLFLAVLFQTAYAKKEDKGFAMAPYLALGCLLAMLPA